MREVSKKRVAVHQNSTAWFPFAIFFVLGIFFTSMLFFYLRPISPFGLKFVFSHFPWIVAGLSLCSFLLSFAVLEYYSLAKNFKLLHAFVLLIFVFLLLGLSLEKVGLHTKLMKNGYKAPYSLEANRLERYSGTVDTMTALNVLTVKTKDGEALKVYLPENTLMLGGSLYVGAHVEVAGYVKEGKVLAKAIITSR